jgi:hypothetical protein
VCTIDSRHELFGTSVLIRFGPELFIFSAAHVLDRRDLWIGTPDGFAPLVGEAIQSTAPQGRQNDRDDVGIVRLGADCRDAFEGVRALSSCELDVDDFALGASSMKHYLVQGFPSKKARFYPAERRARFGGFLLTSTPATAEQYRDINVTDLAHLVLDFEKETARTSDGQSIAPDVYGVSGGAVWTLGEGFDADGTGARLAGIAIEWHRRTKVIVGTRVSLYCEVLRQHRSDLSPWIPRSSRLRVTSPGP